MCSSDLTGTSRTDFDAVVPVNTGSYRELSQTTVRPTGRHPIVEGVTSFYVNSWIEYPYYGVAAGATTLATWYYNNSVPFAAASEIGQGRSVYLGPPYTALGVFSLGNGPADRLLEQAVAWVASGGFDTADNYVLAVKAGDNLVISTTTPGGGSAAPANDLDALLELYDPAGALVARNDNGAADSRNALISYAVPVDAGGNYRVRVVARAAGSGDYTLDVQGDRKSVV